MFISRLFLSLLLAAASNATPTLRDKSHRLLLRAVPLPAKVEQNGATLYTGQEEHFGPISKADINAKSEEFFNNVRQSHTQDAGMAGVPLPRVAVAHKHGDAIYYATSMPVEAPGSGISQPNAFVDTAKTNNQILLAKPKNDLTPAQKKFQGQVRAGKATSTHHTQPKGAIDPDPKKNLAKCAEAGSCRQIEAKHGPDVDMQGDKISAYGIHGITGVAGITEGHLEACQKGIEHKQFNCNGVTHQKGLDDVNRPGRPDSSAGNSPKPASPIRIPSPRPTTSANDKPESPKTPPHYELPTQASLAKQRSKSPEHGKTLRRRALVQRAVAEWVAAELDLHSSIII